jgi:hypothetical protein
MKSSLKTKQNVKRVGLIDQQQFLKNPLVSFI